MLKHPCSLTRLFAFSLNYLPCSRTIFTKWTGRDCRDFHNLSIFCQGHFIWQDKMTLLCIPTTMNFACLQQCAWQKLQWKGTGTWLFGTIDHHERRGLVEAILDFSAFSPLLTIFFYTALLPRMPSRNGLGISIDITRKQPSEVYLTIALISGHFFCHFFQCCKCGIAPIFIDILFLQGKR